MTPTRSFSSLSSAFAAASFFFASESSFLCWSMDLERLFSLFCRLAMLVAAVAGWKLTLAARHTAARHKLTPRSSLLRAGSGRAWRGVWPGICSRKGFA